MSYPIACTLVNSDTINQLTTPETSKRSINFSPTYFNPAPTDKRFEQTSIDSVLHTCRVLGNNQHYQNMTGWTDLL